MPKCGKFTMRSYSAGGAAPRGLATRWAVTAAVCLLATGCTAQFKHLKNEPLALAIDDESVATSTEPEDAAEDASEQDLPRISATETSLETVIPSPVTPPPVAAAPMTPPVTASSNAANQTPRPFDAFLALNDPDIVASRSTVVKTASLTVADSPKPTADRQTEERNDSTGAPDDIPNNGPQEPKRLLPVVIPPPQQAGTSPAGQGTALAPTPGPMTVQNPYVRLAAAQVTSADDGPSDDVGTDEFILVEDGLEAVDTKRQAPGEFNAQPAKPISDRVRDAADRPITSVGVNIQPPAGAMPDDLAADLFTGRGEIRFDGQPQGATSGLAYFWQSPAVWHRPLSL